MGNKIIKWMWKCYLMWCPFYWKFNKGKENDERFIEKQEIIKCIDGIRDGLFSGRNWRLILKQKLVKDSLQEK